MNVMEQEKKKIIEIKEITREEALRKFKAAKQRKAACVARMSEILKKDYFEQTGKVLADSEIEVW